MRRVAALAVALLAAASFLFGTAAGGSTNGLGAERTAHLEDADNGVEVAVKAPESLSGFAGYDYAFSLTGSPGTHASTYNLSVVVSPGKDTEVRWNGTAAVAAGASNVTAHVIIPPDALPFTAANTPFAIELIAPNGTLVDAAQFSVDLHYREPPPDGGLLALALASASVWGVVFLYALNLHLAQRKLRAKVDALDGAQVGPSAGGRADGKQP